MLVLESENDRALTRSYPLDVLVAQTQGMIGYWLAQCLRDEGVTKPVVSLVTRTLVGPCDPGFAVLTKFVGPGYDRQPAQDLAAQHGWNVAADGEKRRLVVPSPAPQRIVEQDSITRLLRCGTVVICGGGGGVPVTQDGDGLLQGVEAVVDKDFVSALLAINLQADRLLVLTDVSAVMAHFGSPQATALRHLDVAELATCGCPPDQRDPRSPPATDS